MTWGKKTILVDFPLSGLGFQGCEGVGGAARVVMRRDELQQGSGRIGRWEDTAEENPYITQPRCILVRSSQHSAVQDNQNPASPFLELQRRTVYPPEEFWLWGEQKKYLSFSHSLSPVFPDLELESKHKTLHRSRVAYLSHMQESLSDLQLPCKLSSST